MMEMGGQILIVISVAYCVNQKPNMRNFLEMSEVWEIVRDLAWSSLERKAKDKKLNLIILTQADLGVYVCWKQGEQSEMGGTTKGKGQTWRKLLSYVLSNQFRLVGEFPHGQGYAHFKLLLNKFK